jgi:hypothetical protein
MILLSNRQYVDNMFWMCWVISIMLRYINDVYEMMHEWKVWFELWFEMFDCLLLLGFKLRKYWLMNWCVKLSMDLYWKHELKTWFMKWDVLYCFKAWGISMNAKHATKWGLQPIGNWSSLLGVIPMRRNNEHVHRMSMNNIVFMSVMFLCYE